MSAIHSIIQRALTHWFIEQVNLIHRSHEHAHHPLIQALEDAGVWSVMLRGSTLFLHPFSHVPFPKNNGDIDCNILGTHRYNRMEAQSRIAELFQQVLRQRGWKLVEDPRPIVHFKDHPTHPILIEKKYLLHKSRWLIQTSFTHAELQSFYNDLQLNIDGIAPIELNEYEMQCVRDYLEHHPNDVLKIELPINCIFRFWTTDLPVYTANGIEISQPTQERFIGWTYYNPLSQLIEKLACVNVPYRNKAIDVVDAFNLIHVLQTQGRELLQTQSESMFQADSRFIHESTINALHAVDVDLAMYIMQHRRLPETFSSRIREGEQTLWHELQNNAESGYLRTLPTREQWSDMCREVKTFSTTFFNTTH